MSELSLLKVSAAPPRMFLSLYVGGPMCETLLSTPNFCSTSLGVTHPPTHCSSVVTHELDPGIVLRFEASGCASCVVGSDPNGCCRGASVLWVTLGPACCVGLVLTPDEFEWDSLVIELALFIALGGVCAPPAGWALPITVALTAAASPILA